MQLVVDAADICQKNLSETHLSGLAWPGHAYLELKLATRAGSMTTTTEGLGGQAAVSLYYVSKYVWCSWCTITDQLELGVSMLKMEFSSRLSVLRTIKANSEAVTSYSQPATCMYLRIVYSVSSGQAV